MLEVKVLLMIKTTMKIANKNTEEKYKNTIINKKLSIKQNSLLQ